MKNLQEENWMAGQKEGIGKGLALRCISNSNKTGNICASAPICTA